MMITGNVDNFNKSVGDVLTPAANWYIGWSRSMTSSVPPAKAEPQGPKDRAQPDLDEGGQIVYNINRSQSPEL